MRCLRYYNSWYRQPVVVLDASDPEKFEELQRGATRLQPQFPLTILHHSADTPLRQRFSDALEVTTTRYVVPMADDDFHFEAGMKAGIAHLEAHTDCGVVYGHVIDFHLGNYVAQGELLHYANGKLNPPARWLQDDSPLDRLTELSKGPWWTTGWYAVQRTAIFKSIIDIAQDASFGNEMLERSMNLMQPIYAKVAKLDVICLARQTNPQQRRQSWMLRGNVAPLKILERTASGVLATIAGLEETRARVAVQSALKLEIRQLRRNQHLDILSRTAARMGVSRSYAALLNVVRRGRRVASHTHSEMDHRLPAPPRLTRETPEIQALAAACHSLPSLQQSLPQTLP
jgi:glycosyltransferase domain-containing protein